MDHSSNYSPSCCVTESQRALELRKFFAPLEVEQEHYDEPNNGILIGDAALSAYSETVTWRLRGVRAMVSLIDRAGQYFIAGSTSDNDGSVTNGPSWFGSKFIPTLGGPCENTLHLEDTMDLYPCFVVNDLSLDPRFAALPAVNGSLAAYRFYAGTPITTKRGINIGTLFIYDDKPRDGLHLSQRKYLCQQAANVMEHLETRRQAAERRRVILMSKGIATFLEKASLVLNPGPEATFKSPEKKMQASTMNGTQPYSAGNWVAGGHTVSETEGPSEPLNATVVDKISMTLDQAAVILRESLELDSGGVVFLDTTIGFTATNSTDAYLDDTTILGTQFQQNKNQQPQQHQEDRNSSLKQPVYEIGKKLSQQSIKASTSKHKMSKVQAISAAEIATSDLDSSILDGKTLQSLLSSYPKGNVWYIDDKGFFSSLDQINDLEDFNRTQPLGSRRSVEGDDIEKQMAEATVLSQIFHRARQIIFLPLWDATGDRWYSGCFVWSQSSVPVFTVESEIAYLSAFTNSVTVEISRLDAVIANKLKSDFISSISHEFRSPLHGILASADFLCESELQASQMELVTTIQNCSGTLLDTIDHILDYSKINSFETSDTKDNISNELYRVTNLALLCEDLVNGMIVAREFRGAQSTYLSSIVSNDLEASPPPAVKIILDIEHQNWDFKVQAGALRRIIMNIFGNAQKYTTSGYILIQVRLQNLAQDGSKETASTSGSKLLIHIRDTGKGMSSEYMERKLYRPFAQEDNFATGVGLGLSIVKSIVNQLRGKILIKSEPGVGTNAEITIPIEKPNSSELAQANPVGRTKLRDDTQGVIQALRARASGKRVLISRAVRYDVATQLQEESWDCIARYCSEWFHYQVILGDENQTQSTPADLIITDQYDGAKLASPGPGSPRILVVYDHIVPNVDTGQHHFPVASIYAPIGPFKLARCILAILDQDHSPPPPSTSTKRSATESRLLSSSSSSVTECLSTHEHQSVENRFVAPNMIPSKPTVSPTYEGSLPRLPSASALTDNGDGQAFTSSRPLILHPLSQAVAQAPREHQPSDLPEQKSFTADFRDKNRGLKILAVDDNVLNLHLIHRYLLKRKLDSVRTACNGHEALLSVREAANQGTYFDIIFMDISMPEMDGFEATKLIRSFERSLSHRSASDMGHFGMVDATPEEGGVIKSRGEPEEHGDGRRKAPHRAYVIALTGLASQRARDEAEASGFDDFLTKPVSFEKIGSLLKHLSMKKVVER